MKNKKIEKVLTPSKAKNLKKVIFALIAFTTIIFALLYTHQLLRYTKCDNCGGIFPNRSSVCCTIDGQCCVTNGCCKRIQG